MAGGYDAAGGDGETESATAAGDGWDDADNWESFDLTPPTKSSTKPSVVCLH